MKKKDIDHFRRQLKLHNDLLHINTIFNVYVMKESDEIYHSEIGPFELLEEEQKELFLANFKKVLSGKIDEKLFSLKFQADVENSSQLILHQGLTSVHLDDWKEQMLLIVEKMLKERYYEHDVVITFIKGEYLRPMNRKSKEYEEHEQDTTFQNQFILCSVNKTQEPKNELLFDYVEKEFKYDVKVDPIINLKTPITGFLFPCIIDGVSDVNHVLYSTGKANEMDEYFVEEVLNAEGTLTAVEYKIVFEEIVKKVAGNQMSTTTLSNVYEEIHRVIEENEDEEETPTLDYKDVENVLKISGVENIETEEVETAFQTVIDDKHYEFKANNVLPKYSSKSIKIKTKVADISVSPEDLKYVRQVIVDGKQCLLIEVEENTIIEGFEMIPEKLS